MTNCIGTDIIEIARIKQAIDRWGERFLQRIYTEPELNLYGKSPQSLAARFAGKEAVIKTLGRSVGWKEIEILSGHRGKPVVHLYGKAQDEANRLGLSNLAISLSHSREYAVAMVIGRAK